MKRERICISARVVSKDFIQNLMDKGLVRFVAIIVSERRYGESVYQYVGDDCNDLFFGELLIDK